MDQILEFNKKEESRKIPQIKPGDTVRVHQKISEGEKERVQIFEGTVLKVNHGYGINGTFTVRKTASGVGVEKIFPFHLPSIIKIELVKRGKVRRSKLYYLRDKQPKEARLKDTGLTNEQKEELSYDEEKIKAEAAAKKEAEEKAKAEKEAKEAAKKEKTEKKEEVKEETKKEEKTEKKDDKKEEKK